jgi:hypothetical protein
MAKGRGNSVSLPSINPHIITHSIAAALVLVPLRLQIHTATKTSAQLKAGGADGRHTSAPLSHLGTTINDATRALLAAL